MSLAPGTRLGPYEILAPLGAGGMGEVYKARDTRLDRAVAIKVLSPDLALDEAFCARFDREAKSISQLSHPHICALHDVGESAPAMPESRTPNPVLSYLVLEYLQGETLATRIARGAIPVDQAITIAVEICGALDNAHRHGVTHRDLKPGNVMLTKTGSKLLDFGLAKSSPAGADGMTRAAPITAQGSILGTFQYMAPEQLEGQEADPRSDIWAFGCTLYEMVTGRPAFAGKTQASLIGAILKDEPARMSTVQPLAPAALDRVIMACLAKDPDGRWQSAADLARELTWVATAPSDPAPPSIVSRTGRRRERLAWMAAIAVVITVAGVSLWRARAQPVGDSGSLVRARLPLATPITIGVNGHPAVAVSPDGRYIAYSAGTPAQLYLRTMDETESRPIEGTGGADYPFFSPDSASLGFLSGRSIKRIALGGGAPVPMVADLDTTQMRGVAWGDDDWIYYTPNYTAGLWRARASGGIPEQLTTPDFARGEKTHRFPFVLPGSQAVLFVVSTSKTTSFDDARIEVLSIATRTRTRLIEGGTYPQYTSTGHLLYTHAGKLIAVPFDAQRLKITRSTVNVADGMFVDISAGSGNHGVSRDGLFVRLAGGTAAMPQTLVAVDRRGAEQPVRAEPGLFSNQAANNGRLSGDGKRLAIFTQGATGQIEVLDLERGTSTFLTDEWDNGSPDWTPDEAHIAFFSTRGGGGGAANLYWQRSDGSAPAERLTTSDHRQAPYSWSPDAKVLAFTDFDPNSGSDIWTLSIDDRKPHPLVKTPAEETGPAFSPDGHWIAYQSNRTGRAEVYVQAFPSGGGAQPVSNTGGTHPMWRGDHEIIYRRGQTVMSVKVATAPTFHAGDPVELFRTPNTLIDLMPDGRLLMLTTTPAPPVTELEIVVNWFQELRRKMAGGR